MMLRFLAALIAVLAMSGMALAVVVVDSDDFTYTYTPVGDTVPRIWDANDFVGPNGSLTNRLWEWYNNGSQSYIRLKNFSVHIETYTIRWEITFALPEGQQIASMSMLGNVHRASAVKNYTRDFKLGFGYIDPETGELTTLFYATKLTPTDPSVAGTSFVDLDLSTLRGTTGSVTLFGYLMWQALDTDVIGSTAMVSSRDHFMFFRKSNTLTDPAFSVHITTEPACCNQGDINRDGTVDMLDVALLAANWLEVPQNPE